MLKAPLSKHMRSTRAAIDLASILAGIVIIGIITGIVGAAIFALIPWTQDRAAKNILTQITTAQNVYTSGSETNGSNGNTATYRTGNTRTYLAAATTNTVADTKTFATLYQLETKKLVNINSGVTTDQPNTSVDGTICIVVASNGAAYTAFARSQTNNIFEIGNTDTTPTKVQTGTTTCAGIAGQANPANTASTPTTTPTIPATPTATPTPTGTSVPTTPPTTWTPNSGAAITGCTPNTLVVYTLLPNTPTTTQLTLAGIIVTSVSPTPQNWAICIDSTQTPYTEISSLSSINNTNTIVEKSGKYWVIHNNPNISVSLISLNISLTLSITFNITLTQTQNLTTLPGLPTGALLGASQPFTMSTTDTIKGLWKTRIDLTALQNLNPTGTPTVTDPNLTLTHDTGNYYYVETNNPTDAISLLNPTTFTIKMK